MKFEIRLGCLACLAAVLLGAVAGAREINVIPVSDHRPLTLTTDESYGYLVLPGAPLRLELVGPGEMTVTVRLNHKKARAVYTGKLNIASNNKNLKPAELNLYRARVGSYKEDDKLQLSLPKKIKVVVPAGVQKYTFTLKAPAGTSMCLGFKYESEADQSAVASDDALALVPLTGGEEDLPPLVMPDAGEEKKPPVVSSPPKTEVAIAPKQPEKDQPTAVSPSVPPKPSEPAAVEKPPAAKEPQLVSVATLPPSPPKKEVSAVEQAAPAPRKPMVSLGLKFGQISPLQKVGGTTYTGSLDLRYLLPLMDGRLSVGVEGGAYRYLLDVTSENRRITTLVVPISVQVFYRIPLRTFLEPFVGGGGDIFWCTGDDKHLATGYQYASGSGLVFGGHLSAGLEANLGPGFLLAEVRAGVSFGSPAAWRSSANIYGLLALVGYRLVL